MLCQNMSNFHNKYKSDGRNISSRHKRVAPRLKSSLQNCYDRQDTLVDSYEISLNQITIALFSLTQIYFLYQHFHHTFTAVHCKKQELFTLRDHLGLPRFFSLLCVRFLVLFLFFCVGLCFSIFCLSSSCVLCAILPVSGLSILDRPFRFL